MLQLQVWEVTGTQAWTLHVILECMVDELYSLSCSTELMSKSKFAIGGICLLGEESKRDLSRGGVLELLICCERDTEPIKRWNKLNGRFWTILTFLRYSFLHTFIRYWGGSDWRCHFWFSSRFRLLQKIDIFIFYFLLSNLYISIYTIRLHTNCNDL